jgi:hypothetical protein
LITSPRLDLGFLIRICRKFFNLLCCESLQRPCGQGLGYNPRNNNNNFLKEGYNGNGNSKKVAMGGNANRGNPNHSFAGKTNPSYMLCKNTDENVVARYVGPRDGYVIDGTLFGYLNLLLLMLGVPLHNGLLNPRIDFVGLFLWWAVV